MGKPISPTPPTERELDLLNEYVELHALSAKTKARMLEIENEVCESLRKRHAKVVKLESGARFRVRVGAETTRISLGLLKARLLRTMSIIQVDSIWQASRKRYKARRPYVLIYATRVEKPCG